MIVVKIVIQVGYYYVFCHIDRSSVTASEHDEYSDSEATQEAVEDS